MTDQEVLNSLVLQRPEPQGFVNVHLHVNDQPEPYASLVNCFLFFAHLFPYVLVVCKTLQHVISCLLVWMIFAMAIGRK